MFVSWRTALHFNMMTEEKDVVLLTVVRRATSHMFWPLDSVLVRVLVQTGLAGHHHHDLASHQVRR